MSMLSITFKVFTGGRGRPSVVRKTVKIPATRGPISGRVNALLEKHVPVRAELVEAKVIG